jgi:DNA-binding MarR family transcriptional regulator
MSTMRKGKFSLIESLGYRISLVARMIERVFENQLSDLGITRGMWTVLLAVEQENYCKPSEIAEFVGIDRTAVSRLLRRLEEKGLVLRSDGEDDGRARAVAVTPSGRKILDAATQAAHETARWYKGKLTEEEQADLHALLDKLSEGEPRNIRAL